MPQLQLPMFPEGVTHITNQLAVMKKDGQVTYFNGHMPVFSHDETDIQTFRMITSQFCVSGHVKQSDIIRAFGVTSISVKRSVKTYREKGPKGFYAPRVRRGAAVLVEDVVGEIEGRLAGGATAAEIAKDLGLKLNTIQKAMRKGRIRTPIVAKKNREAHSRHKQLSSDGGQLDVVRVINDRCKVRTHDGRRAVIVSGIVLAEYSLGDRVGEAYAMVTLVEQGLADQNDVAQAFGCSTRTVRRYQRRFEDGGVEALGDGRGRWPREAPSLANEVIE
jgi:transposase